MAADAQSDAAGQAANASRESNAAAIAEQQRQFEAVRALLSPYVNAGTGSLSAQQDLLGLKGAGPQKAAITAIEGSPMFSSLMTQGENALRQNASATGGLRGGNLQTSLAKFRPQLLSALIEQQFAKLGGITSIGQNAAAGTGNAGMSTGTNISNLLMRDGDNQAAALLAQGKSQAGGWGALSGGVSQFAGSGGFDKLFKPSGSVGDDWF